MSGDLHESSAGGTVTDGSLSPRPATAALPALPNAPGWFARVAQHPTQTITLAGMLTLGIFQGWAQVAAGTDDKALEDRLAEIENIKAEETRRDTASKNAQVCADGIDQIRADISALGDLHSAHAGEQLEFQAEIATYAHEAADALGKKLHVANMPQPSSRFDEYTKKGYARGAKRIYR